MIDEPTQNWPAGHRAALVLTFDVDAEYGVINHYGADAWQWRSQAKYDLETGVWRILRILEDFDIAASFCWVGRAAEDRPDAVRAAFDAGHEIAARGWDHRYYTAMSRAEQRADIAKTCDAIEAITGGRPVGHKTPGWRFNEETVAALQDLDLRWNMDIASADLPYLLAPDIDKQPIVQLPPSRLWDDYTYFVDTMMPPPDAFECWRAELDTLRAEGKLMCFTFHPFVAGRPGPSTALVNFLDYVASLGDVWIARADQVATCWLEQSKRP